MIATSALALVVAGVLAAPAAPPEDRREVHLQARPADELRVDVPVIDELADGEVLVVRAIGGIPGARGQVGQCRVTVDGFDGCANLFPIQFDDDGEATFQYQVFALDGCDGTGAACAIVAGDEDETRLAHAITVFGAEAPPPPEVTLNPSGPYEPGARVGVELASLTPGSVARIAFCAEECGIETRVVAGDDGSATATVVLGERCERCGVVVVAGAATTRVGVEFTSPPALGYDAARLIAGLTLAAVFLLLAWRIVAGVDWRPPSEADTPELDSEPA